jgi:hypothetical protein
MVITEFVFNELKSWLKYKYIEHIKRQEFYFNVIDIYIDYSYYFNKELPLLHIEINKYSKLIIFNTEKTYFVEDFLYLPRLNTIFELISNIKEYDSYQVDKFYTKNPFIPDLFDKIKELHDKEQRQKQLDNLPKRKPDIVDLQEENNTFKPTYLVSIQDKDFFVSDFKDIETARKKAKSLLETYPIDKVYISKTIECYENKTVITTSEDNLSQ